LCGATTLYNTYWIRFEYRGETFDRAIQDSIALIRAAERAGVRRIVHVSITHPDERSPLPYFRGKAIVERAIRESSLSHAILRPAVLFGHGDVLINNIAWLLRRLPVFAGPSSGEYGLRPIHVDDLARLAVREGTASDAVNSTIDAVGPEQVTFNQLVVMLKNAVRSRSLILHLPPRVALAFSRIAGVAVRDVMLTSDEVDGLLAGLLESPGPPAGSIRLSDWLRDNGDSIGRRYASEVARHYR
jgi:NADH dehydrogenase